MLEAELNSSRFNSGKEPTDEMLAKIMHEVASGNTSKASSFSSAYSLFLPQARQ